MAFLKKVPRSEKWYICYRDPQTGRRRQKATNFSQKNAADCRAAMRLRDKFSADEAIAFSAHGDDFLAWVPQHIATHYTNEHSRERYASAWERVSEWLATKKIRHPAEIRPRHGQEYMHWRIGTGASHNTARLELKFLSYLMTDAALNEIIPANPLVSYKVGRVGVKEKPDLSDSDIRKTRRAFAAKEPWFSVAFEICLNIGCRFSESSIPKERINFRHLEITLSDSKRKPHDPKKLFTVPIKKEFAAYLKKLPFPDGLTVPPLTSVMNQRFNEIMAKACGATSHSCRVSFVSRCHRAGLSEIEAMRLVNHSRSIVHSIYSRLSPSDVRPALARVKPPPPPGLKNP